jgi:TonB-linked SusC/RagA family outer membrane protein
MIMNYKKLSLAFIAILALTHTPLQSSAREATMTTSTATEQANDEINVKGHVVDETGEPVIGASIIQNGTTKGTVTDLDGNFSLNVNSGASITISYVGYTSQNMKVTSSAPLKITLKEEKTNLNEVVVVGYGTQKKANLTGSVSSVDSKDLGNRALTSVALGIQGKMPGVTIVNAGGTPGRDDSGTSIHVRGTGSFNNSSPMIVVDGIESTMYDIDPNDIESMSVLKDAASAAIYFYDQSGFQTTNNLRISGGSEAIRYMASVGYTDQNGIIRNSGMNKYNIRLNLDSKVSNRLDASFNMAYTREDITRPTGPNGNDYTTYFYVLNKLSPMVPCYKTDGTYGYIGDGNPIAWFDNNSVQDQFRNNLQTIASLTYHILPELSLKGTAAYKLYYGETHDMHKAIQYDDIYNQGTVDKLSENIYRDDRVSGDILLTYEKTFNKVHNLKAMAGYHAELYRNNGLTGYRDNFANSNLYDLDAASAQNMSNKGNSVKFSMLSYFGRVNYDYMGKYLFEGDLRYDGTSRFASGHRWGMFPSFSAGWRMSEEKFFEPLRKVVDNVKLRASWGQLGNQDIIGYYPTVSTLTLGQNYPFGGSIQTGAVTVNAVNKNLKWETTTTWGVGLDMNLLGKLSVVMDYYNKTTNGILMTINTPITFALSNYYDNVGKIRNSGFEFSATWNDKIGQVGYSVGGNIAFNKNKILSMGGTGDQYMYDTNGACYGIMREGEAFHSFYGYKTDGYFQSEDEIAKAYPKGHIQLSGRDPKPGDIKYVDANGDGKLDANDRCVLGSWDPGITFGFNLSANWNGFDIMAVLQGATDVHGYITREGVGYINGDTSKPTTLWLDHWTTDNRNATMPRLIQGMEGWSMPTTTSDFWMQDATYLRMKTLQIGYNLPKAWLTKIGVANVRLFYTAENLFTLTSFMKGYDPEAPVSADNMKGNYYPQTKTHSFGINLTF